MGLSIVDPRQSKHTKTESSRLSISLDSELHDACVSENVKNVGELIKIGADRTKVKSYKTDYYRLLHFLFENLKDMDYCSLLDFTITSLGKESYEEAFRCMLIIAGSKGYSIILETILIRGIEMGEGTIKSWLTNTDKDGQTVLTHVILGQQQNKADTDTCADHKRCMDILMERRQYLNIDAKDKKGNTALHYAVQQGKNDTLNHRTLSKVLIKNGASINVKNKEGVCVIDIIPAKSIEDVLNECIIEPNISSKDRDDEDYELAMDFRSLDTRNESEFIKSLHNSQSHNHLLHHPLVATYLHITWQQTKFVYFLSLLLNYIFFGLIFFYMFYRRKYQVLFGTHYKDLYEIILKATITFIGLIMIIREIVQSCVFRANYLKSLENYLELAVILLTPWMLYVEDMYAKQSIEALLVILIPIEFFLHLEKIDIFDTSRYIKMFRKIAYNYLKLGYLLAGMFIAFGVSFYLSFQEPISHDVLERVKNSTFTNTFWKLIGLNKKDSVFSLNEQEAMEIFNQTESGYAATWIESVIKTLVMSTGQFDLDKLDFASYPVSVMIMSLFMFSIYLVSMNFLNGIAVSDIQNMRTDAFGNVKHHVQCLLLFEHLKALFSKKKCQIFDEKIHEIFITTYPNRSKDIRVKCEGQKHKDHKHEYLIPTEIVTAAMQVKEELERKEQRNTKKVILEDIQRQQRNTERRLQQVENSICLINCEMTTRLKYIEKCMEMLLKQTKKSDDIFKDSLVESQDR